MLVLKSVLHPVLKIILWPVLAVLTVAAGVLSYASGLFRLIGGAAGAAILLSGIIGGIAGVLPEAEAMRTCIGGIAIGILPGMLLSAGYALVCLLRRAITRI